MAYTGTMKMMRMMYLCVCACVGAGCTCTRGVAGGAHTWHATRQRCGVRALRAAAHLEQRLCVVLEVAEYLQSGTHRRGSAVVCDKYHQP
jgi:hypothetical protein